MMGKEQVRDGIGMRGPTGFVPTPILSTSLTTSTTDQTIQRRFG